MGVIEGLGGVLAALSGPVGIVIAAVVAALLYSLLCGTHLKRS